MIEQKKNKLFIVLAGIFLTNAIIAELIGVKIFSGENSIGLSPANLHLLGFTMDFTLNKILGQGQRIIVASLAAFLVGQLIDVFVFQKLRKVTGSKMLWLRATGSTLISQFIDSFVVLYLAFTGIFTNNCYWYY